MKPTCKYGANCYRKNADHLEHFLHPLSKKAKAGEDGVPVAAVANDNSPEHALFRSNDLLGLILLRGAAATFAELCRLRGVNKRFRDVIDSKAAEAVNTLFHFEPLEGRQETLAWQLANDWYCYWDDSFGMPQDREADYVFRPTLFECRDGFVIPNGGSLEALNAPREEMMSLGRALSRCAQMAKVINGKIRLEAFGSEGSTPLSVMILPWYDGEVSGIKCKCSTALSYHLAGVSCRVDYRSSESAFRTC